MVEYSLSKKMVGDISERCLRCFKEQYWFGENFLFNYINEDSIKGKRVLEIGCAEAGLLKFYNDNGAMCSGLELSETRFNNAMILNDKARTRAHAPASSKIRISFIFLTKQYIKNKIHGQLVLI